MTHSTPSALENLESQRVETLTDNVEVQRLESNSEKEIENIETELENLCLSVTNQVIDKEN